MPEITEEEVETIIKAAESLGMTHRHHDIIPGSLRAQLTITFVKDTTPEVQNLGGGMRTIKDPQKEISGGGRHFRGARENIAELYYG